jgi:hypothetical protein
MKLESYVIILCILKFVCDKSNSDTLYFIPRKKIVVYLRINQFTYPGN